jgi:hypothetical protein
MRVRAFGKKVSEFRGGVFIARRVHRGSLVISVRLRRITTMLGFIAEAGL